MTMFLAPYTTIADLDGSPLDAGFLYLGEYGKDPEIFPIEAFWDADFTIPAAQPIRTRNGYPVRNGSPAKVYLKATQHSIAIKNRKGAFVLVDFKNKGWADSVVTTWSGRIQEQENKNKNFTNVLESGGTLNPSLGYRKRLLANIPFKYPSYAQFSGVFGQYNCFPQGFTFDPVTQYIYLAIQSNSMTTVAVWDISDQSNLVFKTIFKLDGVTYTNEGLIVKWEGGNRNLYFRNNSDRLMRLDITVLPSGGAVIPSSSFFDTGIPTARNFASYGDLFIVSNTTPSIGTGLNSRGAYQIYDKDYNFVDSIVVNGAGVIESTTYSDVLPKIQGFNKTKGGYIGSTGGAPTGISTYTNVGTLLWDEQGNLTSQAIITSDTIKNYVEDVLGKTVHYCEAEGVYSDPSGRVYTLVLYINERNQSGAEDGGVLIFEEFSTHPDAYDFSNGMTYTPSPLSNYEAQLYPITYFKEVGGGYVNGYQNPFTGKAFRDWYEICGYMISAGVSKFSYYANSGVNVKPKDMLGNEVPTSLGLITIQNANNNTFFVECLSQTGFVIYRLGYDSQIQTLFTQKYLNKVELEMDTPNIEFRRNSGDQLVQQGQVTMTAAGNFGLYDLTHKVGWIILGDSNGEALIDRNLRVGGNLHSNSPTNAYSLGIPSRLWSTVYAVTGTINTSDERYKQQFRTQTEREKAAAIEIKDSICLFKFNDAVDLKGDGARWHVGVKAQQVISILESHDLNPFDYGFVCFDEWEEQDEIIESWDDEFNESGELVREAGSHVTLEYRPAGSRYAIRYDELAMFILSAI